MSADSQIPAKVLIVDDDRPLRHALARVLEGAGFAVETAEDGVEALGKVGEVSADLMLLDLGLPKLNGMEVLDRMRGLELPPRVIVMTADDTPETLLHAIRHQAYEYVTKPFPPASITEIVQRALADPGAAVPIEVISARPEWVELLVPCALEVTDRIQSFMMRLDADLPDNVRESVGQAFRELLSNAIEWGGKCDRTRKVRIAYLRARRMVLYRIADPGQGFKLDSLAHSAINNPADNPLEHALVREEKGLRPGGFGIFLVREMVDELIYNETRNEVVFVKYLD